MTTTTVEEVFIFLNDETNMHNVKLILVNLVFFEEKKVYFVIFVNTFTKKVCTIVIRFFGLEKVHS